MARKHSVKPKGSKSGPKAFNKNDGKLKHWERLEDIPLDEEDRFHANKDRILLNGNEDDLDDEGDEDEVFALKGMPEDSDEEEGSGDEVDDDEDMEADEIPEAPKQAKKKSKSKKGKTSPPSSETSDSESEEEGWGNKKAAYYASNDAQIDSEDEEANELEEQEAKRLQSKARDTLADDDFGLGDAIEEADEPEDDIAEVPVSVTPSLPQDRPSLLRHLEKTSPEALALARDWEDVALTLVKTKAKIEEMESLSPDALSLGMTHLHYQTLLTYATTLAFYLHLRASEKYATHPELLKSHPIMGRLLTLKQSLSTLEEISAEDSSDDDEDEDDEDVDAYNLWAMDQLKGLEADELQGLLEDASDLINPSKGISEEKENSNKSNKKKKAPSQEDERPKKKRKTSSETKPSVAIPIFDLVEPEFPSKKSSKVANKSSSSSRSNTDDVDAFGEYNSLQNADAEDKAARKRSLRFHTAKIESATARRERARAGAGGDDDIPWKDRKRDKDARTKKELAKTRGQGGADLDDEEPQPRDTKRDGLDIEMDGSDNDDAEGYYDLVKRKSKEKKEKKKAEYDEIQAATRLQHVEEDVDGPRSLTRAILKNRGLTPHRSKSVRNPRVKKRQRYEKAKKKISSQKAVYKGGVGAGKYEGEKSGISKVIKSVSL
ncbi:SAS10 family protein [Abortiporus biennis]